jgi:hypothetical protein
MGLEEYEASEGAGRLHARLGHKVVQLHQASGGVWAADRERLWRPSAAGRVPGERQVDQLADRLVDERRLLPTLEAPFRLRRLTPGQAVTSSKDRKGERAADAVVQRSARWGVDVQVGDLAVPVTGGGGRFGLTLGAEGEVAGFQGVWRPVGGSFEAKAIPLATLDEQFEALTSGLKIESVESELAYYSAPAAASQEFLYPVRNYRAVASFDDHRVPLRVIQLPATEFGPRRPASQPMAKRRPGKRASSRLPKGTKRSLRTLGWPFFNPFEAGTSWIGESGGLGGSAGNVRGFVDGMRADGWLINFDWGDANAWESDWHRNDDDWVDAADFVFYTGHASMDGWVLSSPDDGFLDFSEVAGSPDRYGQNDLEWVVIAACGPLQDELLSPGGGDVFNRWGPAFDGLHLLLGYGAITFDNSDEGRLVVQYAREGETLVDAWFRTATEVQPSTNGASAPDGPDIWVGAVWPYKAGVGPVEGDHLWGHGSVTPDIDDPDGWVAMWTTT